jgi:DNA-binding CsgD family transcriptional regulator
MRGSTIAPIGRAHLIRTVLSGIDDGAPVCLVGDPGIGKTTVWRACIEQTPARPAWVATCAEAEQDMGLAVLADLFAAIPRPLIDDLPAPQRTAVDVVLLRTEAGDAGVDERQLGMTTASLLGALAKREPALLAVDDLQWCDPASLTALRFALRRVDPHSIAFLGARRGTAPSALPGELAVQVQALDPDEVARLIRASRLELRPQALARVVEVSHGNPFYALELARAVSPGTDVLRVPPSLKSLLARRFDGLTTACADALLDVAVRGSLPDCVELADAYERGLITADGPAARFSHPLLAEATRERATPARLRAAHRRAADVAVDPVAHARHRALAAPDPDEDVAVALDKAVEFAHQRGDLTGARDLAELALAMTPDGVRPIHRVAALARAEGLLAHDGAAHELAEDLAQRATDPRDRLLGLTILARTSPVPEAVSYLDAATQLDGLTPEALLQARGEQAWLLLSAGRGQEARMLLEATLRETSPETPEWATLMARLGVLQLKAGLLPDEDAMRRAVELDRKGQVNPGGTALETAAHIATCDDRHADARQYFAEAAAQSAALGDGNITHDVDVAHMELRFGYLRDARAAAERLSDGRVHDRGQRDLGLLARICAWQGDMDSAGRALSAARQAEAETSRPGAHIAADTAEGTIALLSGDPARALQVLRSVVERLDALGVREPSVAGVLPLAIEAAAAAGEVEEAVLLCQKLGELASALRNRWGSASVLCGEGHIALARGQAAEAVDLFDRAASAFDVLDLPLEQGRALLAAGSTLRRMGRRTQARQRLLAGQTALAVAGAEGLLRVADAELDRLGPHDADDLTATERQVAHLAASGLRNTEIGRQLTISPKTVERHLGNVYRKLGLRGRGELSAALNERRPART